METKNKPDLRPKHLQDLRKSCLIDQTILKAGYISSEFGWQIPIQDPITGEEIFRRTKLDNPKLDEDGKVTQKYSQPAGSGTYPYYSQQIENWDLVFSDPASPVIIVEGEKKADCAIQAGFVAIGLLGVYCFRENGKLHPALESVFSKGRKVYICFDNDRKEKTRDYVNQATKTLAKLAYRHGCEVKKISLPLLKGESKTGLDDFFLSYGDKAKDMFQKLMNEAEDPLKGVFKAPHKVHEYLNSINGSRLDMSLLPNRLIEIMNYAKNVTDSPDEFILSGIKSACQAVLGRKVRIKAPGGPMYCNQWNMCIGASGRRKTTALKLSWNVLDEINKPLIESHNQLMESYEKSLAIYHHAMKKNPGQTSVTKPIYPQSKRIMIPQDVTYQRLHESMGKDMPGGLLAYPDELTTLFAMAERKGNEGFKQFLIFLFGGGGSYQYETKHGERYPAPRDPFLSIIGASTFELFARSVTHTDMFSGFIARFDIVIDPNSKKPLAYPRKAQEAWKEKGEPLLRKLLEDLSNISKVTNSNDSQLDEVESTDNQVITFELDSEATEYWEHQYNNDQLDAGFGVISDGIVANGFRRLNDGTTFKIALLWHCLKQPPNGDSLDKYISKDTLIQAMGMVRFYKKNLIILAKSLTSTSYNNPMVEKIIQHVTPHFKEGINKSKLETKCHKWGRKGQSEDKKGNRELVMFNHAFELLETLGLIDVVEVNNKSNNHSKTYIVYPLIQMEFKE